MQKSHKIITHSYNYLSYYKTDLRRENLSLHNSASTLNRIICYTHTRVLIIVVSLLLLLAVDHTATSLDRGSVVCAAFLDLRKAFDSLDHCLLLQRISELGVHSTVVEWFIDYLSNRCHKIKSSATFSSWRRRVAYPRGVPWGHCCFQFM